MVQGTNTWSLVFITLFVVLMALTFLDSCCLLINFHLNMIKISQFHKLKIIACLLHIYLDLSRIFRRFFFKRLIRFFFHLSLMMAVVVANERIVKI